MDISNYTYDFLPGTDIYYYQHPQMFHVNTDTALLGNFMTIRKKDVVMDIGCNMAHCCCMRCAMSQNS